METIFASDSALLDLLRTSSSMTVTDFVSAMKVTPTAVRQRLNRLMAQGYIERSSTPGGRGRPCHRYNLTSRGHSQAGTNFQDLALAMWRELRSIKDSDIRRGLIKRISDHLAGKYADAVAGAGPAERMASLARVFAERRVPLSVRESEGLPVLLALACPYPALAEQDRAVCAMETMLFSELLGAPVHLAGCRLDGEPCCTFALN